MKNNNMTQNNRLKIKNEGFSGNISLNQYVKWDALSLVNFVNCRFIEIDFLGKVINLCSFTKCKFIETVFKDNNLDFMSAVEVKCSNLNECTNLEESSDFGKILKDLNMTFDG